MVRAGEIGQEVRLFFPNGQMKRLTQYAKGMREGSDELWNERGSRSIKGRMPRESRLDFTATSLAMGRYKEELFSSHSLSI